MFIVEDNFHAEWMGRFRSFEEALQELKNYSTIPWDEIPNCPPCTSWKTCHRDYHIVEYDISYDPWREIKKTRSIIQRYNLENQSVTICTNL